jgi:hypothetical protein
MEQSLINETTESPTSINGTQTPKRTTIALSLMVHGEAVRYNRGKTGSRYDFKHMIGPKGPNFPIPYVSSQCFKKHWRETLPFIPSPIIREKDAKGQEKNQAYTSGEPMKYVDDDLFGYMIAGAAETESGESSDAEDAPPEAPEDQDAKLAAVSFDADQLKKDKTWIKLLKDDSSALVRQVVDLLPAEAREEFDSTPDSANLSDNLRQAITDVLNGLLEVTPETDIFTENYFPDLGKKAGKKQADALQIKNDLTVRMTRLELLQKAFTKGFEVKKKRDTTRRTAPVRMHALVAFSGIKTAEDFQTFSRDVALTGKNSILNPNNIGIYSGWLKTRILIEAFRVGKFYIGSNMDILRDQVGEYSVQNEPNPYDRQNATVEFIQIANEERLHRVGVALQSLGDIGNAHGPASGALHDGSLKPRAFIGALMNCADSPFDAVWEDNNGAPRLNLSRLKAVLRDWDDLFENKTLYIGIAPELLGDDDVETFSLVINETVAPLGFDAVVDTPRRALKAMAQKISA